VYKKLIKNSQPFGKKFQKTVGGIFFDWHCTSCVRRTHSFALKEKYLVQQKRSYAPGAICQKGEVEYVITEFVPDFFLPRDAL